MNYREHECVVKNKKKKRERGYCSSKRVMSEKLRISTFTWSKRLFSEYSCLHRTAPHSPHNNLLLIDCPSPTLVSWISWISLLLYPISLYILCIPSTIFKPCLLFLPSTLFLLPVLPWDLSWGEHSYILLLFPFPP